jgi:hypothetical protein
MDKMAAVINKNIGVVLALIGFLATFALLVIYVSDARGEIGAVKGEIREVKAVQKEEIEVLRSMAISLGDKSRDHREFKEALKQLREDEKENRKITNGILTKITEAVIIQTQILNSMQRDLNNINRPPLYQQLKRGK